MIKHALQRLKCWLGYHTEDCRLVAYSRPVWNDGHVQYLDCGTREHWHCKFCGEFIRFGPWPWP